MLIEDDGGLADVVRSYLDEHGFQVEIVGRGDVALDRIRREIPDVVLLDVGLSGCDGLSLCREIRRHYDGIIVMMTVRVDEIDEVMGLEVGADDYLTKPIRPRALVARLRAHLRRTGERKPPSSEREWIAVGDLCIDPARRSVMYRGAIISVSCSEYELLEILAKRAGEVVHREDLLGAIRGIRYDGLNRSIDLRISRLRRKLADDPKRPTLIVSVRGVGYMLAASHRADAPQAIDGS
ncbi:response regulator [Pendulispora rubella]